MPLARTNGVNSASTDPSVITGWWRTCDCNVGVATGKASNLMVLDVDPRNGGDASLRRLLAEHGPLPLTVGVRAPSGGAHHWFRYPDDGRTMPSSNGRVGPGLDVKADRGGVVAPPSIRDDGKYTWARSGATSLAAPPASLVELGRPPAPPPRIARPLRHEVSRYVGMRLVACPTLPEPLAVVLRPDVAAGRAALSSSAGRESPLHAAQAST